MRATATRRPPEAFRPAPLDPERYTAPGPDPDRVLLIGGAALDRGVLALGVARALADRTARGATIDLVADADPTVAEMPALVPAGRAPRYDAAVVAFGRADASRMTATARFRSDLATLLDRLRGSLAPEAQVVLLSPSPLTRTPRESSSTYERAATHARTLEHLALAVCTGRPRVHLLRGEGSWQPPADGPGPGHQALRIVGVLAPALARRAERPTWPPTRDPRYRTESL